MAAATRHAETGHSCSAILPPRQICKLCAMFEILYNIGKRCLLVPSPCRKRIHYKHFYTRLSYISALRPQMSQPSPQPLHILKAVSRTSPPPTLPAPYSACVRRSCTAPATGWSRRPRRAWHPGRPAVNCARGGGTVGTVHQLSVL